MHGIAAPPSTPDVLDRLVKDVLAGGDRVLMADSVEGCSLLDQAAADLRERRSRVCRVHVAGPDGLGLSGLLAQLRQGPGKGAAQGAGQDGDADQVLERDFATLTTLDPSCDRIVLLASDAHRMQPGALRYLDLVCQASADLRLVFACTPRLLEFLDEPQYPGLAARFGRVPVAAAPAFTNNPAQARSADPTAPAPPMFPPAASVAAVAARPAPSRGARVATFDPEQDGIAPWEFAAAAARPPPPQASASPAARAMHREPPRRPAAGTVRPAAFRPLAPRRASTGNAVRFDLQTAAALGAMAAAVAIYFTWTGQHTKPPAFLPPSPIVQSDGPPSSMMPATSPQPSAEPQRDAQSAPVTNPPAAQTPAALAPPVTTPANPAPSSAVPARSDGLAAAPSAPPPAAGVDPATAASDPATRLPLPPKPARVPREHREPATRYASPAPSPRSNHTGYLPETQAWYDRNASPSYTPPPSSLPSPPPSPPQVQRPLRDRPADSDPYENWARTDSPTPPYIGTYTAGPNGVRSFRYGQ